MPSTPTIVVIGAGPVGLAFAASVNDATVHVFDRAPSPTMPQGAMNVRVVSLSAGRVNQLERLSAWQHIPKERIAPVTSMEVFTPDGAHGIAFETPPGAEQLACIVELNAVAAALAGVAANRNNIQLHWQSTIEHVERAAAAWRITLANGASIKADLLVLADGRDSRWREVCGIQAAAKTYDATAVVAAFRASAPHGGVARQWFCDRSVLALLPLPDRHQVSMVWSLPQAVANTKCALALPELAADVSAIVASTLGELSALAPAAAFPLALVTLEEPIGDAVAALGDAAHVVHPLAGQGLNLGLQDAEALALAINNRGSLQAPGSAAVLRRYARERAEPTLAMQAATDAFARVFAGPGVLREGAGAAMRAVDRLRVMKRTLADHAMR